MTFLAYFTSIIAFGMAALLLIRARAPYGFMLWFFKAFAGVLALVGVIVGVLGARLAVAVAAPLAIGIGATAALILGWFMWQIITTPADFNAAFGAGWQQKIASRQQSGLLRRRWVIPQKYYCARTYHPGWLHTSSRRARRRYQRRFRVWRVDKVAKIKQQPGPDLNVWARRCLFAFVWFVVNSVAF